MKGVAPFRRRERVIAPVRVGLQVSVLVWVAVLT
jgi:hypothetical protein